MAERDLQAEMNAWKKKRDLQAEMDAFRSGQPSVKGPEKEKEAWYEDFGEGIASSGINTYMGIKDLLTDLDADDVALKKDWEEDAAESGWGTGGRVVGEIAQLAVPGGAGLKAARALNAAGKMAKTAKALPLAADVAGSAAHGYVSQTGDHESRMTQAKQAGSAALAGGAIGRTIAPVFRGLKGTMAARRLRSEGADLTPGMMYPDTLGKVENFGEYLVPGLSKSIKKRKDEAAKSIQRAVLRKSSPPTKATILKDKPVRFEPTETGWGGIKQVQKAYDEGYDAAWKSADDISYGSVSKMDKLAKDGIEDLSEVESVVIKRVMRDISKKIDTGKASPADIDKLIRKRIGGNANTYELDAVLKEMRGAVRDNLSKDGQRALNRLDKKYSKLLTLQNASGYRKAASKRGNYGAGDLMAGSKKFTSPAKYARGEGPLQQYAADWTEAIGDSPGMLMSTTRRLVQSIPDIIPLGKQGSNLIAGNYKWQDELRKRLQSEVADQLRTGISTARLGAAYEE